MGMRRKKKLRKHGIENGNVKTKWKKGKTYSNIVEKE